MAVISIIKGEERESVCVQLLEQSAGFGQNQTPYTKESCFPKGERKDNWREKAKVSNKKVYLVLSLAVLHSNLQCEKLLPTMANRPVISPRLKKHLH